ncbi:Ethanolamine ammonia lyase (fragment) [[Clostridium] ultunense Esp]|uniref:Ethanolamine ammonia lyase n=1 Tax=[Clostridium] ultunense Esp TaxID=1288971 RepID=A0A1M4PPE0_9FIRM
MVATAGTDLEGIIAGKGANADEFSKKKGVVVANLDIGGGTTNIVVFKNGNVIDTSCFDIGGRLIKVDKTKKRITYISEKINYLAQSIGLDMKVGGNADYRKLELISERMVSVLEEIKLYEAKETIRATVVGTGSHTTDISGSTIKYSEEVPPLKNIPILKLTEEDENLNF